MAALVADRRLDRHDKNDDLSAAGPSRLTRPKILTRPWWAHQHPFALQIFSILFFFGAAESCKVCNQVQWTNNRLHSLCYTPGPFHNKDFLRELSNPRYARMQSTHTFRDRSRRPGEPLGTGNRRNSGPSVDHRTKFAAEMNCM